ncbi:CPBP family intramembrane metalloprotease (plasmid) [Hymenobacter tibetensis]|uniref:CPBP family intramembrane metalloprotease n=1 Tax=Hymenobacter tibetensis TaxID=497967 RepID=A0ABY4D550_9BACT|nr:CPBP family intramembrane glutamic endopeptidase [Hymenobacter tibetensis]UOG77631.1 CPBP family intramembrane metalloprotease [Hymenobacter tibetensis]
MNERNDSRNLHAPNEPPRSALPAVVFMVVCSPIWLAPQLLPVPHPAVLVVALLLLTFLFLRRENRSLAVLGLNASWLRMGQLLAGLIGGALLMLVVALCINVSLPLPWAYNPLFSPTAAVLSLVALLWGNAVEELVFRGYSFERLIASIGHWKAQLVTALLFALFHLVQGWPWQVALVGTTVGSLLFGLVVARWRSVPAAIGVHAALNWTTGLLLQDPPNAKTLFAPLSPRPWTTTEVMMAGAISSGVLLSACVVLWRQYLRSTEAARAEVACNVPAEQDQVEPYEP